MLEVTAILVAAAVVYGIARATKIPPLPLLILAGVGLTAVGSMPDREFVIGMLEVGLVFLVFAAGMDMSPARVGKQTDLALKVGVIQFGALAMIAGWLALRTGFDLQQSLYVALAISASSTLVVVRLLKQRQELFEPFGRMIIGVLLLQDLLVVAALVILAALAHEDTTQMIVVFETSLALLAAAVVLGKWVLPRFIERYRNEDETLLLIVLAVLFGFVGLAHIGGVPVVVGAFLAGLSLSGFPARSLTRGLLTSLSDFFIVVFFISLGALVAIPSPTAIVTGLVLVVLVLVITPLLVAYVAEKAGMTSRGALEAGILLAQTSEFSIIVGILGLEHGSISADLFSVIVLVTVTTMILTPFLSSKRTVRWLMRYHPKPSGRAAETETNGHIVIVGGGTAGKYLLEKMRAQGEVKAVVVDRDPVVVNQMRLKDWDAVWGEADDEHVLIKAGIATARAAIITTGDLRHLEQASQLAADQTHFWFHAFDEDQAAKALELGAQTVVYADAASEAFMDWYNERFPKP